MPTEVSGGGAGTQVQPGAQTAVFTDLLWEQAVVADASASPSDTPTGPVARLQIDAVPRFFIWIYNVAQGDWFGAELTP